MDNSWVKTYRKMVDWEWYSDLYVHRIFSHLLITANYEPGQWQGMAIEPGQKVTSLPHLAQETGLTIQQARTALLKLKSTGEITDKATNKFRLITINKWSEYQASNRQNNRPATDNQQTDEQASNSNKRNKEIKKGRIKEKKKTELTASAVASADIVSVFDIFKVLAEPDYGNTTQRKAIEHLVKAYGLEKTVAAAKYAVSVQSQKYAPVITNPYQLKTKFGELVAFKARQDNGAKEAPKGKNYG